MLHTPVKANSRSDMFAILPFNSDKKTVFLNKRSDDLRDDNIKANWLSAIAGTVEHGTPAENARQMLVDLGFASFKLDHVATIAATNEATSPTTHLFLAKISDSTKITAANAQRKIHAPASIEMEIHELANIINSNITNDGIIFILFQNLQIYHPNLI